VAEIIRTQNFQDAAADLLNVSIIARDLCPADKTELNGDDCYQVRFIAEGRFGEDSLH
jgi:hypothetical protein